MQQPYSVSLGVAPQPAPPGVTLPPGATFIPHVDYSIANGVSLKLDVAIPPGPGPFPGLIMIHGGGWAQGSKECWPAAFPTYLARGIACFPVEYRLSGVAPYPAAVDDCLAARRWIRAQAAELGIDPDRLAVIGGSAGGHLSLMVGTATPGAGDLNARGQRLRSLVVAVVSLSGPTDLVHYREGETTPRPEAPETESMLDKFIGGTLADVPEKYANASPLYHVSPDSAPSFLAQGTEDPYVPCSQATKMADKLKAAGVPVKLMLFEGCGHEVQGLSMMPEAVEFLVEHLSPAETSH